MLYYDKDAYIIPRQKRNEVIIYLAERLFHLSSSDQGFSMQVSGVESV